MTLNTIDLSHLTKDEKEKILKVLQRDERLRELEKKRIGNLKDEVKNLRLKGTIRENKDASRSCARCRQPFGRIFETGDVCPKCRQKVCKKCQEMIANGRWICIFCFRQMEFEAKSGTWFYSKFPRTMKDVVTKEVISAAKMVKEAFEATAGKSEKKNLKAVSQFQMKQNVIMTSAVLHPQPSTGSLATFKTQNESSTSSAGSLLVMPQSQNQQTVSVESREPASLNQSADSDPLLKDVQGNQIIPESLNTEVFKPFRIDIMTEETDEEEERKKDIIISRDSVVSTNVNERNFNKIEQQPPVNTNLTRLSAMTGSAESMMSCYSSAGEVNFGKIAVTGEIQFGLRYDEKLETLEVTIKRCKDLAPADAKRNRSDPYVKCYLLPDKSRTGKRKTNSKKNTLNPVFDEILRYPVKRSQIEMRTLSVMIWHNDRFGRNDFLGEVNLPLTFDVLADNSLKWYKLEPRKSILPSSLSYKGDLVISLKFSNAKQIGGKVVSIMDKGELQVLVKQARNLTAVRTGESSDPFCKACILPNRRKDDKQKTSVMKRNCNPVWNHTFIFEDLTDDELRESSLELTIWDHDKITSHEFLGGVRLNLGTGKSDGKEVEWMDGKGDEISLWQAMIHRPNSWIDGSLLLRVHMGSRK